MPQEIRERIAAGEVIDAEIIYQSGVIGNVAAHGTGAINVDACRVGTAQDQDNARVNKGGGGIWNSGTAKSGERQHAGRWPANVCHDGSDEVLEAFARFGERPSGSGQKSNRTSDWFEGGPLKSIPGQSTGADTGTAARFFFCGKATREERSRPP